MAKITLARALKIKNRLSGRFAQVTNDITTYNSQSVQVVEEKVQSPEVNVSELFDQREALRTALVKIKMLIAGANAGIQQAIYEIAEAKGDITFFAGLTTTHGFQASHYGPGGTQYVAFKRKADVDAEKKRLESLVDTLQEKIDKHNHATQIEVPDEIIALAS